MSDQKPKQRPARQVLDEAAKRKIIAMLANGSSRRTAARYIGCSPGTITRTAYRDPEFGRELSRAEETAQIAILRSIREAAQQHRYWRAGAWFLERRYPEEFGPRPPRTYTCEQIGQFFAHWLMVFSEFVPEENHDAMMEAFDRLCEEFQNGEEERRIGEYFAKPLPPLPKRESDEEAESPSPDAAPPGCS